MIEEKRKYCRGGRRVARKAGKLAYLKNNLRRAKTPFREKNIQRKKNLYLFVPLFSIYKKSCFLKSFFYIFSHVATLLGRKKKLSFFSYQRISYPSHVIRGGGTQGKKQERTLFIRSAAVFGKLCLTKLQRKWSNF